MTVLNSDGICESGLKHASVICSTVPIRLVSLVCIAKVPVFGLKERTYDGIADEKLLLIWQYSGHYESVDKIGSKKFNTSPSSA